MSIKDRFCSRGRLWVDTANSRLVKGMIRRVLRAVHRLIPHKKPETIRNPKVRFIYDRFTEIIKRPESENIRDLLLQLRDFSVLLCDDDRAYFYAFNFFMVGLYLHLTDFYVTEEDFYLTAEERRKFNAIKEVVTRLML